MAVREWEGQFISPEEYDRLQNLYGPLAQAVRDLIDATAAAQQFLACVKLTGQSFGAAHIIAVLRGSRASWGPNGHPI